MSGGNPTTNCSDGSDALKQSIQFSSQIECPSYLKTSFPNSIRDQIWRVDALLITEAVLEVIIVGIGAYGQRYRHHPFTRFIFLGATTLFLPIVSYVVSTVTANPDYVNGEYDDINHEMSAMVAICDASGHFDILIIWAVLVQIVMVNTSTITAVEDREGRSVGPSIELVVQGIWTIYLGFASNWSYLDDSISGIDILFIAAFSPLCAKIVLKYYAFEKARRSFALGRNPGLVFVYMEQLQVHEANQHSETPVGSDAPPPPLLVMREELKQVELQPRGYAFKDDSGTRLLDKIGLVTFDRVWQLDSSVLAILTPQLKDICLSFALFKLLRCRFARYKLTNAGSMGTLSFFRSLLLGEQDRVFRIIADELYFVHDYYYSSLPISYATCCLLVLNILLSLLTIAYCAFLALKAMAVVFLAVGDDDYYQLGCHILYIQDHLVLYVKDISIGRFLLDAVVLLLLPVLVVIVEIRDIISYCCSNWTKVALLCRYVNRASWEHSFCMQKWVSFLLRCRCKLMKHWDEKMSQCSVLIIQPRTSPLVLVKRLLRLPDNRTKVKMPEAVKVCIISALRSSINGGLSNGVASLQRSQFGENLLWACDGKDTSDTILVWHIATCILEVKRRYQRDQEHGSPPNANSDHNITATHLSRYCAYLVTWCPELLPDNNAWSKSLYEAVKKDADRALAEHRHPAAGSSTPEDEYHKLVEMLSANSKHEVLKDGVKLGKQLVEKIDDEETVWKLLAEFWSEMIVYVALSDNLKGHSEAIARGGELITLLWALLFHAGIVSRPGEEDGAAATTPAGAV